MGMIASPTYIQTDGHSNRLNAALLPALWTLTTLVGGVLLMLLAMREPNNGNLDVFTNDPLSKGIPLLAVRGALAGAIAGVMVGIGQWLLLMRFASTRSLMQSTRASRWVAATAVGWAVAGAIFIALSWAMLKDYSFGSAGAQVYTFFSFAVAGALAGVATGLGQWLLLRGKLVDSRRWLASMTLGWVAGCAVGFAISALVLLLTEATGIRYELAPLLVALFALQWVVAVTIGSVISRRRLNALMEQRQEGGDDGQEDIEQGIVAGGRFRSVYFHTLLRWVWIPLLLLAWYFSEPLQWVAYGAVYSVDKAVTEATQPRSFKLSGHTGIIEAVAWSPDGTRIASASDDGTARIWQISPDKRKVQTIAAFTGHHRNVTGVAWSPDGKRVATSSLDGTVQVWDSATGTDIVGLEHSGGREAYSVAWSPDGRWLAAGGKGSISVWDVSNVAAPRKEAALSDGSTWISRLSWSPDGSRVSSASDGGGAYVWEASTWRQVTVLPHDNGAWGATWSPDGKRIATVSYEQAYVWDVESGQKLLTLDPGPHNGFSAVKSVAWSADGKRLAVGYEDGVIKLWNPDTGQCLGELNAFTYSMYSLAWSPDGTLLASASGSDVQVWELPAGK